MADVEEKAGAEGLRFVKIGQTDHPPGSLPASLAELGRLKGLAALRFTIQAVRKTTEMICRDAPDAIRREQIQVLLVDQTEPAGGTDVAGTGCPGRVSRCRRRNGSGRNRRSQRSTGQPATRPARYR